MLSSDGKYINQVDSGILRCRKSYFSLKNVGMPYPGLPVDHEAPLLAHHMSPYFNLRAWNRLFK